MPVAVVTGAAKGLGRAIAERLARAGYEVCAADIDADGAAQTAASIGPRAWSERLDVRDRDACRALATDAARRGGLEVWVNNAGVILAGRPWEHTEEQVDRTIEINLLGVIRGSLAALGVMREQGRGHIVNIASMAALVAVPGETVYSASKHGVIAFSLGLAGDLRATGSEVTVSTICPDAASTAMVWDVLDEPAAGLVFSGTRLITPKEVADVVATVLERPRAVTAIPRYRGAISRVMDAFPRLALRAQPLIVRLGNLNRGRTRRAAPPVDEDDVNAAREPARRS